MSADHSRMGTGLVGMTQGPEGLGDPGALSLALPPPPPQPAGRGGTEAQTGSDLPEVTQWEGAGLWPHPPAPPAALDPVCALQVVAPRAAEQVSPGPGWSE